MRRISSPFWVVVTDGQTTSEVDELPLCATACPSRVPSYSAMVALMKVALVAEKVKDAGPADESVMLKRAYVKVLEPIEPLPSEVQPDGVDGTVPL